MTNTFKAIIAALGAIMLGVVFFESGLWETITHSENMERHPPELDPLRTAILQEVHLEPVIEAEGAVGSKLKAKVVVVTYAFVPADVDQKELEATTKSIVKRYIPTAESIRVQLKVRR